jgi:MOSC domain-containing protein YiiM
MITLDPDTAEANPDILRKLTRAHDGMAGVYGAVLVEGTVHRGDDIELISWPTPPGLPDKGSDRS